MGSTTVGKRLLAPLAGLAQWGLGWRLFGSFAAALVALAVVGAVAIWQLRVDELAFQRTVGGNARATQLAFEMRTTHLDAHRNQKNALLRGDDPERFRTYAGRFDQNVASLRELRGQLGELDPYMNEQERAYLAVFDQEWPEYVQAWQRAVEAYGGPGGGNVKAADAIMRGKDNGFDRALQNLTVSLSDRRRSDARAAMGAIRDTAQWVSVVLALTTVVGLLIALLAARGIARAVRQSGAMAQAAKFRALGQLAGGVAHDVNQSLGIIAGYGELAFEALSRNQPDLVRAREGLELITRAAMDAGETIARLLRFTRTAPEGPAERVDAGDLLAEVAKLTAPRWRDAAQTERRIITVEVATTGDTAIVGWPSQLREALTNLVLNAVDALPHGGTIRLSARPTPAGVEVSVADSGVGMSAEVRAQIFEPFFTTKGEKGTGLGLAVVFGIVETHGGRIAVNSAPGQGTTFTMTFPTAPPEAAEPVESLSGRASTRTLSILAIDDEPSLARLAALMLRRNGHRVMVAESGEQALQLLGQASYDLVLSDLGLGEGITGWELAEEVRRRWPGVRFVLATGWGAEIDPVQARRRGVDAVVNKPYRLRDLERALQVVAV